jgi:hypothetical protein
VGSWTEGSDGGEKARKKKALHEKKKSTASD